MANRQNMTSGPCVNHMTVADWVDLATKEKRGDTLWIKTICTRCGSLIGFRPASDAGANGKLPAPSRGKRKV